MNLIRGQCLICKQKEQVLNTAEARPFLKYIINTYFTNKKIGLKELKYRIHPKSLCVVCACNVETSYKFKKTYENKVRKESVIKKTLNSCLVCGFRGFGLVKTEDNPNDFQENLCLFMRAISKSRPYNQCAVCFVCVLELQNFNKINAVLQEEVEFSNNKIEEIILSEDEDLKIVPFVKSIPNVGVSTPNKLHLRSKRKRAASASPNEEIPPAKLPKIHLSKQYFKNSSDIMSVKALSKTEKIKIPRPAIRDKKMYSNLPVIELEKVNSDIIKSKANVEIIKHVGKSKRTSIAADSTFTDSVEYQKPKVSIRIKLLSKKRNFKPCPKSKKDLTKCIECNQVFTTLCQFKSHLLWHEKRAFLKVNLTRDPIISKLTAESQNNKNAVEEKDHSVEVDKKKDEEVDEGKDEDVIEDSQELLKIPDNEDDAMDTIPLNDKNDSTETNNIQEEVNGITDKSENKVAQEEINEEINNSKEGKDGNSDDDNIIPFNFEGLNDKIEYIIVDEVADDSNKMDVGAQEEVKTHKENHIGDENESQVNNASQPSQIGNEIVEEDKQIEEPSEQNKEVTEKENKTDETAQINSEETNEEYHDANDEIDLILSESQKCSQKCLLHKQSSEDSSEEGNHLDAEESEEQTEKDQDWQEKSSEGISDEDTDKTNELESTIEKKLRLILGEDEKTPSDHKEDSAWDEACSEKEMFDLNVLNNTILKKSTRKSSEESPKTTKKVRFIVDSDGVEKESSKKKPQTSKDVEILLSENLMLNE
ncbi:putative leucine-rich repeat-containing protein DDB_G0290503 isoform X1 [Agrilus planipennis]|uniref:Leucine-rich repeat-containing protein DDB_G0290503 isoform X1 n=1 Tax=Agrilus planipennis TaxID=224129 RepID=A0A1W4XH98_AGRPL|nr:putative leucine-rich repeat-containing protein DDB_G0290503 isoform X1 [Agrilus planipennis]